MTRPVTVVGLAPVQLGGGRVSLPWDPESPAGRRLAMLAGVDPWQLAEHLGLVNLCGSPDPTRQDLRAAGAVFSMTKGRRYLLAGSEVVRALGRRARPAPDPARGLLPWHSAPPVLTWYRSVEGVELAVLPHPSGRNRWYNDLGCRRAAAAFVASCLGKARRRP